MTQNGTHQNLSWRRKYFVCQMDFFCKRHSSLHLSRVNNPKYKWYLKWMYFSFTKDTHHKMSTARLSRSVAFRMDRIICRLAGTNTLVRCRCGLAWHGCRAATTTTKILLMSSLATFTSSYLMLFSLFCFIFQFMLYFKGVAVATPAKEVDKTVTAASSKRNQNRGSHRNHMCPKLSPMSGEASAAYWLVADISGYICGWRRSRRRGPAKDRRGHDVAVPLLLCLGGIGQARSLKGREQGWMKI